MSIGFTIKRLRRERDLTQEQLAEYLGITSRAVSQWETGRTAPDISQIPALCNYFEVTADELLGIDITQKNAKRDALLDEESHLAKNGYHKEAWELLHRGIQQFPGDYRIMREIVISSEFIIYTGEYTADEEKDIRRECKRCCDQILESCNDDGIRHTAIEHLCHYYSEIGDEDRAIEYAKKMPILCQSRDFLFAGIFKGDHGIHANQQLTNMLIQFLGNRISYNYKTDSEELLYSADELAELRDKAIAFFELMFEKGDYGFYNYVLCDLHCAQARKYHAVKKDSKKVIDHLNRAVSHAIRFIEYMKMETFTYSSALFKGYTDSSSGVMVSESDNKAAEMLKQLACPEYDFVKGSREFESLRERLTPYAGKNDYK